MDKAYILIWNEAKKYLNQGRWFDLSHTLVALDFVKRLNLLEKGDETITIPAIMLHDIGYSAFSKIKDLAILTTAPWIPPFSKELKKAHLIEGARISEQILQKVKYDARKSEEIVEIVETHENEDDSRFKKNLNQAIVADADALTRVTDMGIRIITEEYGLKEEDVVANFIKHLDRWFLTKSARNMADEELRKVSAFIKSTGMWK